jgi:hypothetical protein
VSYLCEVNVADAQTQDGLLRSKKPIVALRTPRPIGSANVGPKACTHFSAARTLNQIRTNSALGIAKGTQARPASYTCLPAIGGPGTVWRGMTAVFYWLLLATWYRKDGTPVPDIKLFNRVAQGDPLAIAYLCAIVIGLVVYARYRTK